MLMADQTINIGLNVSSNGTTDAEIKKASQLNSVLKDAQRSAGSTKAVQTASAATSGGAGDSNFARGITGQTGAAGRDFAAQAQGLGGLVHVYATFAANIFAVSAAFTALSKAADFELMTKGLDQIGAASGRNLGTMAKRLVEITDGAVNLKTALTATAQANATGITADQLSRLAAVAATASHALGRDLNESLERLLLGVTKNQPKLLDELGIIVHVGKAASDYAQVLGKSVSSLSEFERNQAFVTAAIKQGESKFKDVVIAANPYSKLLAEVTNTAYRAGEAFNTILGPIAKFLGENPTALATVLGAFTAMLLGKAIPALTQWREELGKVAIRSAETARIARDNYQDFLTSKDIGPGQTLQRQADQHKAAARQILEQHKGLMSETSKTTYKTFETGPTSNFNVGDNIAAGQRIAELKKQVLADQAAVTAANIKGALVDEEIAKRKLAQTIALKDAAVQYGTEVKLGAYAAAEAAKKDMAAEIEANKKAGYFSEEKIRERNLARAELAATKAKLLSTLGQDIQQKGHMDAFASLRENIKNSNLSAFQASLVTVRGGIQTVVSGVSSLASSLSQAFMVVGIGIAAFEILDSVFSKNTKALADFKTALKYLTDSVEGAQRTIDFYTKNSEKAFSSEGIIAYANAFNEISGSIQKASTNLEKLKEISGRAFTDINKNNWWERLGDETAALFGGGIQKNASKALAAALADAVKLAGTGPEAAKLQEFIANNLNPKTNNAKGYQNALAETDPEQFARKFEILSKGIAASNLAINNTASSLKEYNEAAKIATDAQEKYLQSLSNNDPLFKFGAALQTEAVKLTKAFQDPTNALAALLELSKDFDKLSLLPIGTATELGKAKKELQSLQDSMTKLNSDVLKAREVAETAKGDVFPPDVARVQKNPTGNYKDSGSNTQAYATALMFAQGKERALIDLRAKIGVETAKFEAKIIQESWEAGSEKIRQSLKYAEEAASISFSKTVLSGLSGSGTANANANLAKQEIDIQLKLIQAQKDALSSQETLRLAIEDQTAQLKIDSLKTSPEEKEKAVRQQALNQVERTSMSTGETANSIKDRIKELDKNNPKDKENQELIARLTVLYQRTVALESRKNVLGMQRKGIEVQAEKDTSKEDAAQRARLLTFATQENAVRISTLNTLKGYSPIFNEILATEGEILAREQEKIAYAQKASELYEIDSQRAITLRNLRNQGYTAQQAEKAFLEQRSNKLREIDVLEQQQDAARLVRIHAIAQARIDSEFLIRGIQDKMAGGRDTIELAKLDIQKNSLEILKNYGTIDEAIYTKELANLNKIGDAIAFNASLRTLETVQAKATADADLKVSSAKSTNKGDEAGNAAVKSALDYQNILKSSQEIEKTALQATYDSKQKIIAANNVIALQAAQFNDLMKIQTNIVDSLTLSFGNFGTAIGGVLTAFTEGLKRNSELTAGYSIQLQQIADQKKAELDKVDKGEDGNDNAAKQAEIAIKYAEKEKAAKVKFTKDTTDNEIASLAKGANALKKNFAEKTAAYKILDAVEKAASAERIVRQAMEFATNLPKYLAEMGLMGGQAVLNQGKGDPYSAIPRMAAMAALVATIMSAFGGNSKVSVSGASQKEIDAATAENVQKIQNTGGVLGDSGATSNSIKNGIEELSKNSFSDLDYTQEMLKSLKNIDKGISAFGVAIARSTGIQGVGPSKFGTTESTSTSAGGNWLFGKKSTTVSTEILDTGIRLTGSIGDFLKGVGKIVQYEKDLITTVTSKSGFLGFGGSTKTDKQIKEQTSDLGETTTKLVSKIIGGMVTSISDAFNLLQLPTENLIDLLSGVDVTGLAASLKGLTGQAASDAIDAFFSNIFDTMADKVAPWVGEFQKVGESMGDTLVRIASDTRTLDYAYAALGVTTLDAAKAAKAANISIEEWVIAQTRANENLLDLAGGLDAFVSKMDYITQNFLTESQKLAPVRKALTEAFSATGSLGKELSKVGLATPKTRAEFVSLLTTLHDMGDAGNAATVALLDVAPAFNKIQGAIEDIISSVGQRISDLEFQMTLDTLDTQGKYALINKTAGEDYAKYMEAVNDKAVSTVDAAKLANKLIDRIQQGWNLLTTEQRQESGVKAKYFADLDEINASLTAKGGAELLGLSNDTISLIDNADSNTNRLIDAIKNSPTKLATESTKAVTKPLEKINESIVSGSKLSSFGDVQQTNLDKQQQTQDMKMIQSQTAAITMSEMLSRAMIAKAMESSAQQLYGMPTGVSTGDVDNLVNATLEAPTRFASAMAATPIVIPPVDVSGIEASVDDLKQTVANMLAILTQQAAEPVNLNVNVQAPRNQEVGVSLV